SGPRKAHRGAASAADPDVQRLLGPGCEHVQRDGPAEVLLKVAGPPAARPRNVERPRRLPLGTIAALLATIPFLLLVSDLLRGTLGVDPVESGIRRTGWWALTLLVATLAVTPLRRITRWNRLIEIRKPLGLAAFAYACIHLVGYV